MQENRVWKQIEAYIRDHREALDIDRPSDDLWDRINQELHDTPVRRLWWRNPTLVRIAAAIALVAAMSYLWYIRLSDELPQGAAASLGEQSTEQTQPPHPGWQEVPSPYQAPIDSMQALPGASQAPSQSLDATLDSLQHSGEPTPARVEQYQQLMQQKDSLLRAATGG